MKHSECPIRQTAVTHVGGADARAGTSGPVRRTEALFFSQQREIRSAKEPSTRGHSPSATTALTTFYLAVFLLLGANSYRNITFTFSRVENSTSWAFANNPNFQLFHHQAFSLLIYSWRWMLMGCWERRASQKPVQHWSALSWTSTSQSWSGRPCWIHSPASPSSAASNRCKTGRKLTAAVVAGFPAKPCSACL